MRSPLLCAIAEAAEALARVARTASDEDFESDDALIPIPVAAKLAATSVRVLRDAIRAGDLSAYGRQRDRAVRRADLEEWVRNRRVVPLPGPDDADLARRVRRLARTGKGSSHGSRPR
jgi:hypothetical protein